MQEVRLKITGMMCQACVGHVTRALEAAPGVSRVEVTLEPGSAIIIADEQIDAEALAEAVRAQDYEAEVVG